MVGSSASTRRALLISAGLAALVVFVFSPVRHFEFVSFDDPWFVSRNTNVLAGLTWHGVAWAFTAGSEFYWHPLTWLSHMLDVQLFGLDAGWHHVTSAVIHGANTLLLFWLLRRMTGATWRSACVAALFAVHPLHVESVAWIAERKDVLSTLFLLLTIWAYVWYAHQPAVRRYLLVMLLFALGLMAKPMLVSLPVVLLVLDLWPLERMRLGQSTQKTRVKGADARRLPVGRLVLEKLPLLALAIASTIVTFLVQRSAGAVAPLDALPLQYRLTNAVVSYVAYIGMTLWPSGLAVFYPYPPGMPAWWKVAGAALACVVISIGAWRTVRRHPYVAAGWLWYLITLLPVIGIVQAGDQVMADRFTYVPFVGLAIVVVWGIPRLVERWSMSRVALPAAAGAAILACAIVARGQVWFWQDSATLWGRALEVTSGNHRAHAGVGALLADAGKYDEAAVHYQEAVRLAPSAANYRSLLGDVYSKQGKQSEAFAEYSAAARLDPGSATAQVNLGTILARQGRAKEAVAHFTEAVRLEPNDAMAHVGLGVSLIAMGQVDAGIAEYNTALRIDPGAPGTFNNLGIAFAGSGRLAEAITAFTEAVRLDPSWELPRFNLGVALAKSGRDREAISAFNDVIRINPGNDAARRALDEMTRQRK